MSETKSKKTTTFSRGDTIVLDGEEYIKVNSMAELEGLMLDNFHIIIHRKDIEIEGRKCFLCGEDFIGRVKELDKHHAIPRKLKSKYNVHIPFCKPCHLKFNRFVNREEK